MDIFDHFMVYFDKYFMESMYMNCLTDLSDI
jgi:hypothetical protein